MDCVYKRILELLFGIRHLLLSCEHQIIEDVEITTRLQSTVGATEIVIYEI